MDGLRHQCRIAEALLKVDATLWRKEIGDIARLLAQLRFAPAA